MHLAWQAAVATRAASLDNEFGHSFEEEWPELARRLERFLRAKGVETWLRADVIQETATRVYRKWPTLDRSRPLWNLVVTIALGVLVDERRKVSRLELVPDVTQSEVDDIEARALQRVSLVRTRSAMKQLSADQRQVLLAEIGEAAALEGPRNRIIVLRLRARLALRSELGPWAPAGVALRMRSVRTSIERRVMEWGRDAQALAASLTTVAVATTMLLPGVGPDAGKGATTANPWSQGSTLQDLQLLSLNEVHEISLARIRAGDPGEPHKLPPKVEGRAKQQAPAVTKPVTDNWHQALEKYHEGLREAHDARDESRNAVLKKYHKTLREAHARRDETHKSGLKEKKEAERKKGDTVRDVRDTLP